MAKANTVCHGSNCHYQNIISTSNLTKGWEKIVVLKCSKIVVEYFFKGNFESFINVKWIYILHKPSST